MPHHKEKEIEFNIVPDGLYRGSIKIEDDASIVIDSFNLKQMNLTTLDYKSSIPGFELEVTRPNPSDVETSLFYELLRNNLGNSIQFQFVLTESRHSRMLVSGMDGIIFCEDPEENIKLSCVFSEPLDISGIK